MANETTLPSALEFESARGVVNQLKVQTSVLQDLFMMGPGQANTVQRDGDKFNEDVFNDVRTVPSAVAPGADYPQSAANPVGNFSSSAIRVADEIPHTGNRLHMLRAIGGSDVVRDTQGRRYLTEQLRVQKGRHSLLRDAAIGGILRDSLYLKPSGANLLPTFTSTGAVQVLTQIPAGHKSQLNVLGGGDIIGTTWSNAAAAIVTDWYQIADAAAQESGTVPTVWLWESATWAACILANTQLLNLAGTSNQIWIENTVDNRGLRRVVLAGMPDVTHYIYDGVVTLDGSTVKIVPANQVLMFPAPMAGQEWFQMIEGSDDYPINGDDSPDVTAFGMVFYFRKDGSKTSSVILQRSNDLFIPFLRIPKAVYAPTVVF
jgi:hypothetical protein